MAEGGDTVVRTVRRSGRGEGHAPLPSSTATDSGTGISPPPGLSPRLIQIRTVCKMAACGIPRPISNMTVCGERLGDDAMGVQGSRARLAGMLAGGGGGWGGIRSVFSSTRAPMETLHQLDAAVDFFMRLSPASPSKAGSRNPLPRLSPRLIQTRTGK